MFPSLYSLCRQCIRADGLLRAQAQVDFALPLEVRADMAAMTIVEAVEDDDVDTFAQMLVRVDALTDINLVRLFNLACVCEAVNVADYIINNYAIQGDTVAELLVASLLRQYTLDTEDPHTTHTHHTHTHHTTHRPHHTHIPHPTNILSRLIHDHPHVYNTVYICGIKQRNVRYVHAALTRGRRYLDYDVLQRGNRLLRDCHNLDTLNGNDAHYPFYDVCAQLLCELNIQPLTSHTRRRGHRYDCRPPRTTRTS